MPAPEQDLNDYHDRIDAIRRDEWALRLEHERKRLDAIADVDDGELLDALTALEQGIRAAEGELLKLSLIFDAKEFDAVGAIIDKACDALIEGLDDAADELGEDAWFAVENPERYTP